MNIKTLLITMLVAVPVIAAEKEIAAIKAVGKEGVGNEAAAAAWKALTAEGMPALVPTLQAFQGANPTAANWLRSALDAILEAEAKKGNKPDAAVLKAFLLDSKNSAEARRIAFELYGKQEPDAAKEIVATFLNDPSLDLRRDAIARRLELAKDDPKILAELFAASRDRDQVEDLAKRLKLEPAAVVKHFNLITKWHVVGPFDGPGFNTAHAPEKGVDLKAGYDGKAGAKLTWKAVETKDSATNYLKEIQVVDLTEAIGKHKDSVAYAFAVVEVEKETPAEIRAGTQNGVKIFVNGTSIFEREAYHQGTSMDQHTGKCTLKAGKNEILIKICQNDQKEPWAQEWVIQARICDSTGGAVPFKLVGP